MFYIVFGDTHSFIFFCWRLQAEIRGLWFVEMGRAWGMKCSPNHWQVFFNSYLMMFDVSVTELTDSRPEIPNLMYHQHWCRKLVEIYCKINFTEMNVPWSHYVYQRTPCEASTPRGFRRPRPGNSPGCPWQWCHLKPDNAAKNAARKGAPGKLHVGEKKVPGYTVASHIFWSFS